ncbi:MAG: helix-turn-helix domain-containing protein [bacterium]|nr:helix-turn-helix domain-containing protein [bacterium]
MASVGNYLKREREKQKINIDQIAEETRIGSKYLKALEADDYAQFPAETYIIGFIRNYARALGLDPAEVINMYKSSKIGEVKPGEEEREKEPEMKSVPAINVMKSREPVRKKSAPVKKTEPVREPKGEREDIEVVELDETPEPEPKPKKDIRERIESLKLFKLPLKERKFINLAYVVIGAAGLMAVILLFLLFKVIFTSLGKGNKDKIYTELSEIKSIEFSGDSLQSDFVPNEYYKIKLGNKLYSILFEKISELTDATKAQDQKALEFVFHINDVTLPLKPGEDKSVDFDFDSVPDLMLKINSFNNDLINANIRKLHTFVDVETNQMVSNATNAMTNRKSIKKGSSEKSTTKQKIIFEGTVREKTYIKAFIDGKEQEGVIYYPKDTIKLEANDVLQLKIGNAGGINVNINGKPTKLGKRGEIANKIIKWEKDPYDESTYNLIIKDWQ